MRGFRISARRTRIVIVALLALFCLTAVPAFAVKPHFSGAITLTVSTSTTAAQATLAVAAHNSGTPANALIADGQLSGLVNPVKVSMVATGTAQVTCSDDDDGYHNPPPAPHPVSFQVTGNTY